jgi:MYXO-CTERM domain-containing protein
VTRSRFARAAALCALAGAALAARPAAAYVRYKTDSGLPFYWPQSCVFITAYPNDLTDMPVDQTVNAATQAAAAWSKEQNTCAFLELTVSSSDGPTPTAKFDSYNNLIFRKDSWCRSTDPPGTCSYDPSALAITSVFVATATGKIRDADIEVNAKNFVWADVTMDMTRGKQDLQNALTHEMGHLIGLDHTCYLPGSSLPRPIDNAGNPVPNCDMAPPDVQATTMFASAEAGDISKRTLAPDDQQAVCDIYPVAADPMSCPPPGPQSTPQTGCTCDLAGAGGASGSTWVLAAAGMVLLRARRRRRARGGGPV